MFSRRHCWQVKVIRGRDWVSVSHGASEGHPEGVALWESSPVLYLPLVTLHAGPTETLPTLFPVLCSPGGAPYWVQESCCTQPGLFHQPEAAWTETWSASKQSTHVFTANVFQGSWPSGPKWKTNNVIIAAKQACSFRLHESGSLPSLFLSLHASCSVWTGGSLGTSAGQLSKEGGGGAHITNPIFPLPALLGQRCPAWPGGFSHPLLFPRPPTLYTIWNLCFLHFHRTLNTVFRTKHQNTVLKPQNETSALHVE